LKLKELEIMNIVQLAEIFSMNAIPKGHPAWKKYVPPFQYVIDEIKNEKTLASQCIRQIRGSLHESQTIVDVVS
jgi:hypothetical protein